MTSHYSTTDVRHYPLGARLLVKRGYAGSPFEIVVHEFSPSTAAMRYSTAYSNSSIWTDEIGRVIVLERLDPKIETDAGRELEKRVAALEEKLRASESLPL